jgi:hypothetical protein
VSDIVSANFTSGNDVVSIQQKNLFETEPDLNIKLFVSELL